MGCKGQAAPGRERIKALEREVRERRQANESLRIAQFNQGSNTRIRSHKNAHTRYGQLVLRGRVSRPCGGQPAKFFATKSQFTRFQNASMNLGRALR